MTAKTLTVRFSAAVCILLSLFVGQGLAQDTKLKWACKASNPGETLTFQGSRIK